MDAFRDSRFSRINAMLSCSPSPPLPPPFEQSNSRMQLGLFVCDKKQKRICRTLRPPSSKNLRYDDVEPPVNLQTK